jgi:type II secretory pathway pseudopilin PulG
MTSAMTTREMTRMRVRSSSGFALIDLLFVTGIIAILCGIALPRLMAAKGAAQSASAIASLRVVGSAQVAFAITCGSGFYAPDLKSLGKAPGGLGQGFLTGDLGSANTVVKSGYQVTLSSTPFGGAPDTCNALGPGKTGLAYKAGADPIDANNLRFFAINAGNTIWEDSATLFAAMPEAGNPGSGSPLNH